ncbi:MAG TPA: hypothetical protein VII37_05315, partial [Candidatus Acidoferrum sp.]
AHQGRQAASAARRSHISRARLAPLPALQTLPQAKKTARQKTPTTGNSCFLIRTNKMIVLLFPT